MGRVLGQFVLEVRVGRGGMGEVWRAVHKEQGTPVAVKIIARHHADKPGFKKGFRTEVRAIAGLGHRHVCGVYDYGTDDEGLPWMAMELGERSLSPDCGRTSWPWLRDVLLSVLDGLAHTHARDIVHRDIKPGNILLCDGVVKLVDFGLAHRDDEPVTTASGTRAYMPPEQIEGRWRDFGPWTDLYALGGTAWALACGAPPVAGRVFAPVHPMPRGLVAWIEQALATSPRDRFPTAAHAARALMAVDESEWIQGQGDAPAPGRDPTIADAASASFTPSGTDVDGGSRSADLELETLEDMEPRDASGSTGPSLGAAELPFPSEWRRARPPSIRLSGVGLGLYGLRAIPLIGREAERDVLWDALAGVLGGDGCQAVVIRGSSGVGKSRLAEWLCRRGRELGVVDVLVARHGANEGVTDGVVPMLRRHLRLEGLDHDAVARRVESLLGAPDPLLAELLQPRQGEPGPEARQLREPGRRQEVIAHAIGRLARRRPLILWLDDAQWGPPVIELARALLDADLPVLSVLTVQEEALAEVDEAVAALDRLTSQASVTELPLAPLAGESRRQLAEELLGLSSDVAEQVAERTAGNPLFAVQLVGDWVQRGILVPASGGFGLRPGASVSLPDAIHDLWVRRLDALLADDQERAALELAALLGVEVDPHEWALACKRGDLRLPEDLVDRMVERGLARPTSGGRWSFDHGMLAESVLRVAEAAGRLPARRSVVHHTLSQLGNDVNDLPEVRGARFERALALAKAAADPDRQAVVLLNLARLQSLLRREEDAGPLLEQALPLARMGSASNRFVEGRIRCNMGVTAKERGELEAAREHYHAALAIAREVGDRSYEGTALSNLGVLEAQLGCLAAANVRYAEALSCYREVGARDSAGIVLLNLAELKCRQGQLAEAGLHAREALALHQETGNRSKEGPSRQVGATLAYELGRWEEAEQGYRTSLAIMAEIRFRAGESQANSALSELLVDQGRQDEAEAAAARALALSREIGQSSLEGAGLACVAAVAARRGDAAVAAATFDEAIAILGDNSQASQAWKARGARAVTWAHLGRPEAVAELVRTVAEVRGWNAAGDLVDVCTFGVEVCALTGDVDRAAAYRDEARSILAALGASPEWAWSRHLARAEALLDRGPPARLRAIEA